MENVKGTNRKRDVRAERRAQLHSRANVFIASILVVIASGRAAAGGLSLTQMSVRGAGMGDVGAASLSVPTLLGANPASLNYVHGTEFSFGTLVIMPDTRYTASDGTETKMQSQVIFPPNVSLMHSFGRISVGISGGTPIAYRTEWGEDWAGAAEAIRSELRVTQITPGIAYQVTKGLAIGAALNIGFPRFAGSRKISSGSTTIGSYDASGESAIGYTAGILLHPAGPIALGATYISRLHLELDPTAVTFTSESDSTGAETTSEGGSVAATVRTAPMLLFGVSLKPFRGLRIECDANRTFWSKASVSVAGAIATVPLMTGWKDTWSYKGGAEADFGDILLRGGYIYDDSPIPATMIGAALPDGTKRGFTAGFGYWVGEGLRLDFAYQLLHFEQDTPGVVSSSSGSSLGSGRYKSTWTVVGINVCYIWD